MTVIIVSNTDDGLNISLLNIKGINITPFFIQWRGLVSFINCEIFMIFTCKVNLRADIKNIVYSLTPQIL